MTGIPIVESPHLPDGTAFLVGPGGFAYHVERAPLRLYDAIAWPDTHLDRLLVDAGLFDVVHAARAAAFAHLERELDRMCTETGLDPEAAWRRPRVAADRRRRDAAWRIGYEFAIHQPTFDPGAFVRAVTSP